MRQEGGKGHEGSRLKMSPLISQPWMCRSRAELCLEGWSGDGEEDIAVL